MEEKVKPVVIKDKETGEQMYVLEFNRRAVATAERNGFKLSHITDFPLTGSQTLFFYSLMMHHGGIDRRKSDDLFDELGGVENVKLILRLVELYNYAIASTKVVEDGEVKNSAYALDL